MLLPGARSGPLAGDARVPSTGNWDFLAISTLPSRFDEVLCRLALRTCARAPPATLPASANLASSGGCCRAALIEASRWRRASEANDGVRSSPTGQGAILEGLGKAEATPGRGSRRVEDAR